MISRRVFELSLALLLVCLVAVASPAGARIGNPIKKAKEKLQKAAGLESQGQTPEGDDVVFDNVVVELTDARVGKVVVAWKKAQAEGSARQELTDQYNQKNSERSAVTNENEEAMNKARNKRSEVEACVREALQKITERKAREIAENPMDPQRLARNAKLAAENNAAAAKGDTAAIQRMQSALNAEMIPSKEDSAAVRKSCGPAPPKLAAERKIEGLDQEIASLSEKMRQFDEKIAKSQAKDGSLTQQQWAVAMERVQMYDAGTKGSKDSGGGRKGKGEKSEGGGDGAAGGGKSEDKDDKSSGDAAVIYVKGFTKAELVVLAKHRAELREALK